LTSCLIGPEKAGIKRKIYFIDPCSSPTSDKNLKFFSRSKIYELCGLVYATLPSGRKVQLKVISWGESSVTVRWNRALAAGSYNIYVKPRQKSSPAVFAGTFTVMPPAIADISPEGCSPLSEITVSGRYFSTLKPKVFIENIATSKRHKCRVTAASMASDSGDSVLRFKVPGAVSRPGEYRLIVQTKAGTANVPLCKH
jgi:hypothetical protein